MKPLGLVKVDALNEAIDWFERGFVKKFDAVRPIFDLRALAFMATDIDDRQVISLVNQFEDGKHLFKRYLSLVSDRYYDRLPLGTRFSLALFESVNLVNGSLRPGVYEMQLSMGGIIYPRHRWLTTLVSPANIGAHVSWWHWVQHFDNPVLSITQL